MMSSVQRYGLSLLAVGAVLLSSCGEGAPVSRLSVRTSSPAAKAPPPPERRIVFLGDSLTRGYHLDPSQAFPALIQKRIVDAELPFTVINAGVSGDTTAGGLSRLDWVLGDGAELLVLELGANDGMRGFELGATRKNLETLIERTRARGIPVVLAGMRIPPNYGEEYTRRFKQMFTDLAEKHDLPLIPFLLEGVGGEHDLNLADGVHPNAEGHRRIAGTVWETLEPILRKLAAHFHAARKAACCKKAAAAGGTCAKCAARKAAGSGSSQ